MARRIAHMSDATQQITVLGAGSMGGAIVQGMVASGIRGITVTNRSQAKADTLADLPGVTSIALEDDADGNHTAAAGADVVIVGVKPAMVVDLLADIASDLRADAIIVSVAAGTTIAAMDAALGGGRKVMRAMPNTPAVVGKAVTGLAANDAVTDADAATVRALFETVGAVVETDEAGIDGLSTISGSGPAYVFLLIEELTKAAIAKGFDEADARLMAEQTFIGAAALLDASGEDPAELRRRVTSPKGTTERAVAVLQDANLEELFTRATDAALARARELAAGA